MGYADVCRRGYVCGRVRGVLLNGVGGDEVGMSYLIIAFKALMLCICLAAMLSEIRGIGRKRRVITPETAMTDTVIWLLVVLAIVL